MYLHLIGKNRNATLAGQKDLTEVELPLQQDERIPVRLHHMPSSREAASLFANGDIVQQSHDVSNQVSNIHGLHRTPDQESASILYHTSNLMITCSMSSTCIACSYAQPLICLLDASKGELMQIWNSFNPLMRQWLQQCWRASD